MFYRDRYEKILQAQLANKIKYWLVEEIENDCIVTRVGVYDEILPKAIFHHTPSSHNTDTINKALKII